MKPSKLILAAGVAAFVIGTVTVARANPLNVADGTYVFNATDGNNYLDGSTVTFSGDTLTSWNLIDSTPVPSYYFDFYGSSLGLYVPPLTPGNSSFFNLTTYAPDGNNAFSFSVASPLGSSATGGSIFWFSGQNNLNGYSALYDGFGGGGPPPTYNDPQGTWTLSATTGGGTGLPDSSDTFQLLLGALISLGACKIFLRGQVSVPGVKNVRIDQ